MRTHGDDSVGRAPSQDQIIKRDLRALWLWLGIFILGLVVSGVTAFPFAAELGFLVPFLRSEPLHSFSKATHLLPWIKRVNEGVQRTAAVYPFLAYGTDGLASAHLVIAVAFVSPWIDPVRNKWVVTFGLIACLGVIPLALIAGRSAAFRFHGVS